MKIGDVVVDFLTDDVALAESSHQLASLHFRMKFGAKNGVKRTEPLCVSKRFLDSTPDFRRKS